MLSLLTFLYSSFNYSYTPLYNKENIVIINKGNVSSDEYINIINDISYETGVYPLYLESDINGENKSLNTYYTNYDSSIPTNYPSIYNTSANLTFDKIDKFSLGEIQVSLLGDNKMNDEFISKLEMKGFDIERDVKFGFTSFFKKFNVNMIILIIIFNIMVMFIYLIHNKKKYAILKLEGYTLNDITTIELHHFNHLNKFLLLILSAFIMICLVLYDFNFCTYFIKNEILVLLVYILFILV